MNAVLAYVHLKDKQIWKLYMDDNALSVNGFKSIEYDPIDLLLLLITVISKTYK